MKIDFIPTFNLELNPYNLVMTENGIVRLDSLKSQASVWSTGTQKIINVLTGIKKNCLTMVLQNGNSLVLEGSNTVYTENGWKKISDLKVGDLVLNKLTIYSSTEGGKPVNWKNIIKGTMLHINVPSNNSEKFSEWLGIMSHGGYLNDDNNKIGIITSDETLGMHFVKLTKDIFNVTPTIMQDKRGNRSTEYYFISKNLIDFLSAYLGSNYSLRKIPLFLQEGSVKEQQAFLKGVSSWSNWETNKLVIYSGLSKPTSEFIAQILRHQGYDASLVVSKIPDNDIQSRYEVKVYGKHPLMGQDISFFKDEDNKINKQSPQFLVSSDGIEQTKVRSFEKRYDTFKKARQQKVPRVYADLLFDIKMPIPEYYWEPVREIKSIGLRDLVNIKILYPTGIIFNQIILSGQL